VAKLLLGRLRSSATSRIVNVTSGGLYAQRLHVDDLQMDRGAFDGTVAYARTKRAELVLAQLWAQRLAGSGVVVHAMRGWADTPGLRTSLPALHRLTRPLLRRPEQAADTIVWLAAVDAAGAAVRCTIVCGLPFSLAATTMSDASAMSTAIEAKITNPAACGGCSRSTRARRDGSR
jgi:NAD(P)-dependent dehydrogenase (short-subunit alcohol dehydrogenase family)